MRGALIHTDHFSGVLDTQARAIDTRVARDQFFKDRSLADKDQV